MSLINSFGKADNETEICCPFNRTRKFCSEYVQMNKGKFNLFDLTNGALKYAIEKYKSK